MSEARAVSGDVRVLVIAKAPEPGRSKTRLTTHCTDEEAAHLAEAALADTLEAVVACRAGRRVLVLDGEPGAWMLPGIDVLPQRGDGLDRRLAAAFEDAGAPSLLIGMDTPQVTPTLLDEAIAALVAPGVDAVLGPAQDGGWWAIGLHEPAPQAFLGVPMSTERTGRVQRARLERLGMRVATLPRLRDVDVVEDALAVAAQAPGSRFARAVDEVLADAFLDPEVVS